MILMMSQAQTVTPWNFNYRRILLDEVALEGLSGIGLQGLWTRMEHRISTKLPFKMKEQFWTVLTSLHGFIMFYELPEAAPEVNVQDRFSFTDETGMLLESPEPLEGPYAYSPVPNEHGSCQHYNERREIAYHIISATSLAEAMERWGDCLALVASVDERWRALSPHQSRHTAVTMNTHQYCLLELVGKARENGIMTTGNTNLSKIVKEPKLVFYTRKNLQRDNLITAMSFVQKINNRSTPSILLRLQRFTVPRVVTLPKHGIIHSLIERLKTMPDHRDDIFSLQKFLKLEWKVMKKIIKRQDTKRFFKRITLAPPRGKKLKMNPNQFLQLELDSEESASEDEDESDPQDLPRTAYRLGVGLLQQVYMRIVDAGENGLSVIQVARMLNIDFYSSRSMMRKLVQTKCIQLVLEDKGRQKIGRYVALASAQENTKSSKYLLEKEKLFTYISQAPAALDNSSFEEIVGGLRPLDPLWNPLDAVEEIREFQNIAPQPPYSETFTSKETKLPSLRLLKIVNTIIKLIWENEVLYGTQELNQVILKEIGQQMDCKTMKRTFQRLIRDNLMHYYRIRWPVQQVRYTILLCAPHITINHHIIKTNFKDICLRSYHSTYHAPKAELKMPKNLPEDLNRQYYYPRYLRARKLHEFLFNLVYGEDAAIQQGLPKGCFNLVDIIPEMTVELCLGHTANRNLELMDLANDSLQLPLKLKDASTHVCSVLLSSQTLVLSVKRNIRTLASFGLIQLCDKYCQQNDGATMINKHIYYLNRNAKFLDTSGKWPQEGRKCEWMKYRFDSCNHVNDYWSTLYNVSTNTVITSPTNEERSVQPPVPVTKPEEAAEQDTGEFLAGDGKGAGGVDSSYHIEIRRLWSSAFIKALNSAGLKRKLVELQRGQPQFRIPRKKPCLARGDSSKPKVMKKKVKPLKPPTMSVAKPKASALPKRRNRIMTLSKWTSLEDKVILWTRVAKHIMGPTGTTGALQIANFLARDIITRTVGPKIATVCHSRALSLERVTSVQKLKDKLIMELKRRPEIIKKYEGVCRPLRLKYLKNIGKYMQEGQLRMAELVWMISRLPVTNTYDRDFPCVVDDLKELEERFTVKCSKRDKLKMTFATVRDIQVATIEQGIIQMMNTLIGETPTMEHSMKIYNVFKDVPEDLMKKAVDYLRKTGTVVHKDKSSNVYKLTSREAVAYSSTFKMSAVYIRCWQNIYSTGFPGKVANALQVMVPTDDVESSSQMTCILLELSAHGDLKIVLTKKPIVKTLGGLSEPDMALADVDERVSVKLQRGKIGWRLTNSTVKHIRDLFDDIALSNEVSCLCSKSVIIPPTQDESSEVANAITVFLEEKREMGATFQELMQVCGMTTEILQDNLKRLEIRNVIKKVGLTDNRVVLCKYVDPWTIMIENDRIVPAPWITMEKTLKQPSFIGWCGAVAQKIIDHPGIPITKIANMCTFLTPKHVEDICSFLRSLDCIQMKRIIVKEPDLFSDVDEEIVLDDLYEYADPEYILVFPVCDSLVRYSLVKKKLSEYKP